jgi:lysosomal alpha-mannosidase
MFYDGYGPPGGFCFDRYCGDEPIMDDPQLEDYNLKTKAEDFVRAAEKQVSFSTNRDP